MAQYDKTREFEKEIEPRMREIQELCLRYRIPFFSVFGVKQTERTDLEKKVKSNVVEQKMDKVIKSNVIAETEEKSYCLVPSLFDELETSDKTFGKLVAVMNGAQPVVKSEARSFTDIDISGSYEATMPDSM